MAESSIASAVAAPGMETEAAGLKRRQSSASEQESKRPRISSGKSSPIATKGEESSDKQTEGSIATAVDVASKPGNTQDARRKSTVTDEKQRSKRLFGALLGNVNQGGDRVSKRRQEIENRRKAELQRQDDERLEDKQRRLEQLAEQRREEQSNIDRKNIRIRHANMLSAANYLQTTTEPRLYYRPWELRPEEEDQIDDQIKQAQAQIDGEDSTFDHERPPNGDDERLPPHIEAAKRDSYPHKNGNGNGNGHVDRGAHGADGADGADGTSETQAESTSKEKPANPDEVPDSEGANAHLDRSNGNGYERDTHSKKEEGDDDEGDHVVEGDEDTVIY